MIFVLAHDEARARAIDAIKHAQPGSVVKIGPPKRTGDQNAALHAKITEIAQRREWCGKRWDVETWKRLLTAAWCRAKNESIVMLPALDGQGVDIVFRRTSKLNKAECSSLLDFVEAWDAMQGA